MSADQIKGLDSSQRSVIDVRPDASTHRFTGFFAEEEPRDVMTCFTLTLRSPVVF